MKLVSRSSRWVMYPVYAIDRALIIRINQSVENGMATPTAHPMDQTVRGRRNWFLEQAISGRTVGSES